MFRKGFLNIPLLFMKYMGWHSGSFPFIRLYYVKWYGRDLDQNLKHLVVVLVSGWNGERLIWATPLSINVATINQMRASASYTHFKTATNLVKHTPEIFKLYIYIYIAPLKSNYLLSYLFKNVFLRIQMQSKYEDISICFVSICYSNKQL